MHCFLDLALAAPPEAPGGNPIDWAIEGRDYAIDWAIDWAITVPSPRNGVLYNPANPDILGRGCSICLGCQGCPGSRRTDSTMWPLNT